MTVPSLFTCIIGPARYRVPPGPFLVALVLTPLVLALAGSFLVVPIFAAILGIPALLLLGGPIAWAITARYVQDTGRVSLGALAAGGFWANLAAFPLGFAALLIMGERPHEVLEIMLGYCGAGVLFAPLQAVIFGALFNLMARPMVPLAPEAEIFS